MILQNLGGVNPEAFAVGAPPGYGEHQLDILYSDLDPAGYMTPAGGMSGIGTPFNSQSRRGSADNLASINAMASTAVLPTALQSRLSQLDSRPGLNVGPAPIPAISGPTDDSDVPASQDASDTLNAGESQQDPNDTLSRRTSEPDSEHSGTGPQHFEFSPEQLSKVPSYSTALRCQPQTPISEVPPTYQSVTGRSPLQSLMPQPPARSQQHGGRK